MQGASDEGAAEIPAGASRDSGSTGRSLWGWLAEPARDFHEQLASDQAFADHVGRSLDTWTAALAFLLYTITATLIFVINAVLYDNG